MEMYKYGSRIPKWEPLSIPATVQVSGARHSSEPAVIDRSRTYILVILFKSIVDVWMTHT